MSGFSPNWLVAPVALPLFTGALLLFIGRWGFRRWLWLQRTLGTVALALNLAVAVALAVETIGQGRRYVLQVGLWDAPFGISVVADGLTAIMLVMGGVVALAVFPYAIATLDYHRERMGFYPLYLVLVMGVNGAFLAGDLFNLYVFFEVLLMASFVLLTVGGQPAQTNSGIHYVVLNLLASIIFLAAAGVAYGTLGTLNMAQMAQRLDMADPSVRTLLAGLLLVGFGSKAALVPFHFWLPTSYHTPPPAVTALFGGLLTKVGIYTLFRSYTLLFPELLVTWQPLLLAIAGVTMVVGALGALAQPTIRRVLSFHIISHVGFMFVGLAVAMDISRLTPGFGLAAALLYLVHHMIVKTGLIMAGGAVELEMGSGRLASIGGLASRRPLLATLFFLSAISLAGLPPFSGFIGKLSLLQAILDAGHWWVVAAGLVASLLTLINIMRLWQQSFWGGYRRPGRSRIRPLEEPWRRVRVLAPLAGTVLLSLALGLGGERAFGWMQVAAQQTLDREGYIRAVAPHPTIPPLDKLPQKE